MIRVLRLLAVVASLTVVSATLLTGHVDTRIGTGGAGFGLGAIPPGPTYPFGSMRLGPDTSYGLEPLRVAFETLGGYYYPHTHIECFSHTHMVGAGVNDLQTFGMTVVRKLHPTSVLNAGYRSRFSHATETAVPGYYAVTLEDAAADVELTVAGKHSGIHRYQCRGNEECTLVFDVCHGAPVTKKLLEFGAQCHSAKVLSVATERNKTVIVASVTAKNSLSGRSPFNGGIRMWLHVEVAARDQSDAPLHLEQRMWVAGALLPPGQLHLNRTSSKSLGVALTANGTTGSTTFTVRSGLSYVGPAAARRNLEAEQHAGDWISFDAARAKASAVWEEQLGTVAVDHTSASRLKVFYSALYRSYLAPTTYTEAGGVYRGFDDTVRTIEESGSCGGATAQQVSDLSLWDTYRTQAPLLLLTQPALLSAQVGSMNRMVTQAPAGGESYPRWPLANFDANCMVGIHGVVVAADAVSKGLRCVDVNHTLALLKAAVARQSREQLRGGFVPQEVSKHGASDTLEYALDAGALVNALTALGRSTEAAPFVAAAKAYTHVFNASARLFCPTWRSGAQWCPAFPLDVVPYPINGHYTEGDAEQYRWYVPHDLPALVALYGREEWVRNLDNFFHDASFWPLGTTLPNPFYWPGNEPTLHTPLLFNLAGPEYAHLTQTVVPAQLDKFYTADPSGIPGNDDYGALSSWAVFAHLGFAPLAGTDRYTVFMPAFDNITLRLPHSAADAAATPFAGVQGGGAVVHVTVVGRAGPSFRYVVRAVLNGRPLDTPFFTQTELNRRLSPTSPATLVLYAAAEPTVFAQPPPSEGGPEPRWPKPRSRAEIAARRRAVEKIARQRGA